MAKVQECLISWFYFFEVVATTAACFSLRANLSFFFSRRTIISFVQIY
jgi:hypothetical protein